MRATDAASVVGGHLGHKSVNARCPPVKGVGIDDLGVSNRAAEQRYQSRQKQVSHRFHSLVNSHVQCQRGGKHHRTPEDCIVEVLDWFFHSQSFFLVELLVC